VAVRTTRRPRPGCRRSRCPSSPRHWVTPGFGLGTDNTGSPAPLAPLFHPAVPSAANGCLLPLFLRKRLANKCRPGLRAGGGRRAGERVPPRSSRSSRPPYSTVQREFTRRLDMPRGSPAVGETLLKFSCATLGSNNMRAIGSSRSSHART